MPTQPSEGRHKALQTANPDFPETLQFQYQTKPYWRHLHILIEKHTKDSKSIITQPKTDNLRHNHIGWLESVIRMSITGTPLMLMNKNITESDRNEGLN
ncbi:hypothetical protein QJS10_CPA10g00539 [Acorus calamus]|uniref:Uncharacterized protein n=1 Tax=Acorus calamus TaxID=4465 RepID=A0AAV9E1H8_ACOCL|nr:hypothetical protein QJS10_CPA10g00539 [Acorus calamus]